jgi:protein CWC15
MRELEKIKKERAAAKAKEEAERAAEEDEQREIDVARGNPLLNSRDFTMKRRWDDDVVFKNQARGTEDRNKKKEFINDMLRSDFHKKFMVSLRGHGLVASANARDSPSTSDEVIAPYFLSACIAGVGGPSARFWNFYPGRIRRRGIFLTWRSTEGQ